MGGDGDLKSGPTYFLTSGGLAEFGRGGEAGFGRDGLGRVGGLDEMC
jgi:hypothetical protein